MSTRTLRRISQWAVFLVFVFLFLNTEYKDNDVLPYAVNVFLRLDPLVAAAAAISGRALASLLWPALVVAGLTALLGRFFCGWACPMGSLLDAVDAAVFSRMRGKDAAPSCWRRYKYLVLAFLAGSALFTLQWVFLFDPISILIRSFAVSVFPAINLVLHGTFDALYRTGAGPIVGISEPVYGFLREHFLAFGQPFFRAAAPVGLIFLSILGAEYFQKRFWCRNLCPLGALLALIGRFGLLRRRVTEDGCTRCGLCEKDCRMGAIRADVETYRGECVGCMDCEAICPEEAIRFAGKYDRREAAVDLTRRGVLSSAALGVLAVPFFRVEAHRKAHFPGLIRPPGALPEDEFLARCTRCGECMRVCIANGLQPTWFEAGLEGMWSPVLVSRIGYCEYNCTLCGQVCPTGAIRRLSLQEKKKVKIGLAEIDRSRCLPWKGQSDCIVCEEHCPTPKKAIVLRKEQGMTMDGEIKLFNRPYVDEGLCIGCGICETRCPLTDRGAVYVTARGESRASAGPGGA